MTPWQLLDRAGVPGAETVLCLYRRGAEYSIKVQGRGELMNSRVHDSETALAAQTCQRLAGGRDLRLLIGGLGMGFTLAAALEHLAADARVTVAELVPAVVAWNRTELGAVAGHPLRDTRVAVHMGDVGQLLQVARGAYDAILLDVDNGPEGLSRPANNALYDEPGLIAAYMALRPRGLLAVWSAGPAREFTARLRKVGFQVDETRVHAHAGKGARHVIWFATRPD